jgi:hypothetical protein
MNLKKVIMKQIISRYIKKFGYTPTIYELHSLYTQGLLSLSNKEENILLIEFEKQSRNDKSI